MKATEATRMKKSIAYR